MRRAPSINPESPMAQHIGANASAAAAKNLVSASFGRDLAIIPFNADGRIMLRNGDDAERDSTSAILIDAEQAEWLIVQLRRIFGIQA